MALNSKQRLGNLECSVSNEKSGRQGLTTDLITLYGLIGALLGWIILDPIAAVMGAFTGGLLAYSVYRLDP